MNPHLLAALLVAATSPLAEPPPPTVPPRNRRGPDRRGPETLSPPEGSNLHVGVDFGNRSSEITFIHRARWTEDREFIHRARWTEDREEKLAKAAAKRLRRQAMRLIDRGSLWYCVMCPGEPWVGDYNPSDLTGECPACGSGVGVFRVERDFPRGPAAIIVHRKIVTGQVDRLDEVPW